VSSIDSAEAALPLDESGVEAGAWAQAPVALPASMQASSQAAFTERSVCFMFRL